MNPISDMLAALGVAAATRSEGATCAQCNTAPVAHVGRRCARCEDLARQAHQRAMLSAARASIPPLFRDLDARELVRRTRMPETMLAQARAALARPRVVLVGASGIGKTSLACWMLRELLETALTGPPAAFQRARWARFVDAGRLCKAVREHPLGEGEASMLSTAIGASVCVLDDVGLELQLRMASNPVVDVIRERHAGGKATWVTTYLTPEAFENGYGSGTARRVFDGATVLCLENGT